MMYIFHVCHDSIIWSKFNKFCRSTGRSKTGRQLTIFHRSTGGSSRHVTGWVGSGKYRLVLFLDCVNQDVRNGKRWTLGLLARWDLLKNRSYTKIGLFWPTYASWALLPMDGLFKWVFCVYRCDIIFSYDFNAMVSVLRLNIMPCQFNQPVR